MSKSIYSPDQKNIAKKLKDARLEAGIDQTLVAKIMGKSQSYVSKIEAGQRRIDVVQLKEFAKVYDKSLDYFIK